MNSPLTIVVMGVCTDCIHCSNRANDLPSLDRGVPAVFVGDNNPRT